MASPFKMAVGELRAAAKAAMGNTRQMAGVSNDPDVRLYEALDENEIKQIFEKFGEDAALDYIHDMESRRMKGG